MIRNRSRSVPDYDHEWSPDDIDVVLEDQKAAIIQGCEWVEIRSSIHSRKHDETFHAYGQECDATRSVECQPVLATVHDVDDVAEPLPEDIDEICDGIREASDEDVSLQFPADTDSYEGVHERVLELVERAWRNDAVTHLGIDPHPGTAHVEASVGPISVLYEPGGPES